MSRTSALILFGILIVLMPFSGLPVSARSFFMTVSGLGVLVIALSLRAREVHEQHTETE